MSSAQSPEQRMFFRSTPAQFMFFRSNACINEKFDSQNVEYNILYIVDIFIYRYICVVNSQGPKCNRARLSLNALRGQKISQDQALSNTRIATKTRFITNFKLKTGLNKVCLVPLVVTGQTS
jgi:hypothetical protein